RIWTLVARIPRGKVVTYGALSQAIARALTPVGVGWALRAAPDGALPWHRVVNARGGVSTDGDHPDPHRAMLETEGGRFDADGVEADRPQDHRRGAAHARLVVDDEHTPRAVPSELRRRRRRDALALRLSGRRKSDGDLRSFSERARDRHDSAERTRALLHDRE